MKEELKSFLIKPGTSLRLAMKQLDDSHSKVLFLVDEEEKLLGTLTDGDVRRWILNGGELETDVTKVCHVKPYFVNENYDIEKVRKEVLKEKYSAVPVVSDEKKIRHIIFWDTLFEDRVDEEFDVEQLDIPVVIMAGGQGTRLEPFTKILPKPLIPIGDKTIIEMIIDKFLKYKLNHFYVSVNHKAAIIKAYFEELSPPYTLEYIHEDKPLGTIGALSYIKNKVKDPILVTNCDIIINTDYNDLLNFHKSNNYDISLVASMMHHKIPYGICEIENGGNLINFKEKPELSYLASTGMYLVNPDLLDLIPENTFYHITQLMEHVRAKGGKVGVYPISEKSWLDTGEWHEYKKTLASFNL